MKGGNFELDEELRRAQLNMGSERTHVRIVVSVYKPTRVIGLVQNGHGETKHRLSCARLDETPSIQIASLKYPGE
jgi:hypothetical protein